MRSKVIVLAVVAALLLGVGVPSATAAPAGEPGAPVAKKAKKKRKAIKCKKNQVPIKVNRRVVGCRSLNAALPPPREADERLSLATSMLDDDLRGLRDRRGRRAPSVKKLFRKAGPRAFRTMQTAIPQGLARLDALAGPTAKALGEGPFVRPLADCGATPPTRSDSYSSSAGGEKLTATLTTGPVSTLGLQLEGGAYTINASITSDECSRFDAPKCPTADGVVEATDSSTFKVTLSIAKSGVVLLSQSFDYSGQTKMRAQVSDDAKLRFFDIDDTQTANIELGGSRQEFGPVQFLYTGIHDVRVTMPDGEYERGKGAVDIAVTAKGVTTGKSDLGDAGARTAKNLDDSFATLVKKEVDNFRGREKGWNNPETRCAEPHFNPGSRSDKLAKGARGSLSVRAVAGEGGGPVEGHWELKGAENANVSPAEADGAAPQFSYEVTNAGKDIVVKVTLGITSKAGVGRAEWVQDTEDKALYRGRVTVSHSEGAGGECPYHLSWSYSARLASGDGADQPFAILQDPLDDESWDAVASDYDRSVSGTVELGECHGVPACSSVVDRGFSRPTFGATPRGTVHVEVFGAIGTRDGDLCGGTLVEDTLATGEFPISMIGRETITVDLTFGEPRGTLTLERVR